MQPAPIGQDRLGLLLIVAFWAATPAEAASGTPAVESADLATGFEEPLITMGPTLAGEDGALARAVRAYRERADADFRPLEGFLAEHPQSGWRVAVLTNLGLSYLHNGYFSRAVEAWEAAWREGKDATELHARALVDRVVGELARLHAGLGHVERLTVLLEEIGDRPVSGSATETVQIARETLGVMQTDPKHLFLCGPQALKILMLAQGADAEQVRFLDKYRAASPKGVSLSELAELAEEARLPYRPVLRHPGDSVPVPSIVHWKIGHFAAIVGEADGRFHVVDPVVGPDGLWVTRAALDEEASGYFLAQVDEGRMAGWRTVDLKDASGVWGAGMTVQPRLGAARLCSGSLGMCGSGIEELVVGLGLSDTPIGYTPPKGPSVRVTLSYNQREDSQPANFSFFNISPKWTLNWLSYVQDNPNTPGSNVMRYLPGGGSFQYVGYSAATGSFTPQDDDASVLTLVSRNPVSYRRSLKDGSVEIYAQSDGSTTNPRRVFLTQIADPAGNAVTLNYDSRLRLTSSTDATGRLTTFSYGLSAQPLLVTAITDPFGRSAALAYDGMGRLSSITDVLGLTSSFTYDASSLISAMTTPYGTTRFAYGTTANSRFLQITDPLGFSEREEWLQPAPVAASDPAATVPKGMTTSNAYHNYRDSFHWDKHAYTVAGCKPTGGCNYNDAHITHFNHYAANQSYEWSSIESVKNPLENRVWYNYSGQTSGSIYSGTYDLPAAIGRVLDDGTTQLTQLQYNAAGNPTSVIDPLKRQTLFTYAANQIDLLTIQQKTAAGNAAIGRFTYNVQHLPLTYTDAAGQTTSYAYNAAGQLVQRTDPLGETTSYRYNGLGYLVAIVNANGAVQASFSYDAFGRVATYTDSEGWTLGYSYDAMDRLTGETYPDGTSRIYTWDKLDLVAVTDRLYPDGTSRIYTWDKLDLVAVTDRQGRTTAYSYDAVRNLVAVTNPLSNTTRLGYYENSKLKSLTDPNGNVTSWDIGVQSRVTAKHYSDGSVVANTFETTTSRLRSITDALGQTKQYGYALDDRLTGISYLDALNPTPNVQFGYDAFFPRIVSMTDGSGTTQYQYVPVGSLGALQPLQEIGPFANVAIAYQYDALGRVIVRAVGGNTETFSYDPIGRLVGHADDLGAFAIGYFGQTGQTTSVQSATVGTSWTYDTNLNDRRLKAITNSGMARGYQYATTPENLITAIAETSGGVPMRNWAYGYDAADRLVAAQSSTPAQYGYAYDPADNLTAIQRPGSTSTLTYNGVNQIRTINGAPFSYDANGNLVQDDQRTYSWDADNRLIGIGYKAQPSLQTSFRYDGLGRRIAIVTANGTAASETLYLWCGEALCQARAANDAVTRRYFTEGEETPGTGTLLYYARDHLGSVRDLLTAQDGGQAASYDYDPYGGATQASRSVSADLRYAGMFYHQDSGLYLTQYRAYDPRTGRWVSRDPIEESSGINLFAYVEGNPVNRLDRRGLQSSPNKTQLMLNKFQPIVDKFVFTNDLSASAINLTNCYNDPSPSQQCESAALKQLDDAQKKQAMMETSVRTVGILLQSLDDQSEGEGIISNWRAMVEYILTKSGPDRNCPVTITNSGTTKFG